jgi:glyoxylase-like metal-dependent hydrolase (beta-lactamase superfamily II)
MSLPTPSPATLPLPGGRAGATVRVHPLCTARMLAPPAFYRRPSGPLGRLRGMGVHVPRRRWSAVPIPAFLVEHPEAGPILIDSGMHADVATDGRAALGRAIATIFAIEMDAGWAVPAQLRERGVDPADVRLVVMTHLHYDHASGLAQFPGATAVVDAREWDAAASGGVLQGYRGALLAPELEWRTYPHEQDEVDLLGDGSIRLLRTPGHTKGHRSVLLRLAGGRELLLTGDAVYGAGMLDDGALPLLSWSDKAYVGSVDRLRAWRDAHPGAVVIAGHDGPAWPRLEAVYA